MKGSRSKQGGFTLIELVMAMGILAVGVLALFQMQLYAVRENVVGKDISTALQLAQDKVEDLRGLAYSDPELSNTNTTNDTNLASTTNIDFTESVSASNETFTRIWNIADDVPLTGMKTVAVTVTWGPNNIAQLTLFTTVRTRVIL